MGELVEPLAASSRILYFPSFEAKSIGSGFIALSNQSWEGGGGGIETPNRGRLSSLILSL